jgi:radical SAM superfamily enzyme YgiQ (UPF0313 family)
MTDIVLATLNARYIHTAFGLRYLLANLGPLAERAVISEFEVAQEPHEIVERILSYSPSIVGFGVYIWNVSKSGEVVSLLKKIAPEIKIVLGGPEVSYDSENEEIVQRSDYVITGEGEIAFRALCEEILLGKVDEVRLGKIRSGGLPVLADIKLPYHLYTEQDLAHRVVYVEASRGCPFTCEFCLSSVDIPVRAFDTDRILSELDALYTRGLRTFKFVDRTFNLNVRTATRILQFFLDRMVPGLFVHFEMVPDRFPTQLREIVAQFPPGSLQFEVGIQSFNPEVGKNISRRQDFQKIAENLSFLREKTGVYIHADLIAGLPGEDVKSFAQGFDRLLKLDPHEIQVGILKRLKGTPIVRHDELFNMKYSDTPPYEILSNNEMTFIEIQQMRRFARFWDLVGNSGNFRDSKYLIWKDSPSPFFAFFELTEWLYQELGRKNAVSLKNLTVKVFEFLTSVKNIQPSVVGEILARDYVRGGRHDLPDVLQPYNSNEQMRMQKQGVTHQGDETIALKRQQRYVT